jgi:hypothetical protein
VTDSSLCGVVELRNEDDHLDSSSPAIDKGNNFVSLPLCHCVSLPFDFDGTSSPKGTAIDIGALEFVP